MKKYIVLTALLLAAIMVMVGCSRGPQLENLIDGALKGQKDGVLDIFQDIAGQVKGDEDEKQDPPPTTKGDKAKEHEGKGSAREVFTDFQEAKTDLIGKMSKILYALPADQWNLIPNFFDIYEVDAIMWGAVLLWEDPDTVKQTGRFFGMNDFRIDKGKDRATMSYVADNGRKISFEARYDEKVDHYILTADYEDGDHPYLEMVKTPYGYAGQAFTGGAGMVNNLYLISIQGEKGIVGIIHDTAKPDPLTGKEAFDFAKSAGEWYQYDDGHLTGLARGGEAIDLHES